MPTTETLIKDKLGRDIRIGDPIAVACCDIDGDPYLGLAHVYEIRDNGVLGTVEDDRRGRHSATRRAAEVVVVPRELDQLIAQFLPAGTTFTAAYHPGGFYEFVVRDDGLIQDSEGDSATMDAIDLQSMRSVVVPKVWH